MAYRLLDKERQIYVKEGSEKPLKTIKKIIFDFDGVLAQTIQSYRETIRQVVDYYFLEILGLEGQKGQLATFLDIQKFKDIGKYNNDWKLSYALISYYMNIIIRKLEPKNGLQKFRKQFSEIQFADLQSFIQNLKKVGEFLSGYGINGTYLAKLKDDSILGLDLFLAQSSLEKQKPIEASLLGADPELLEKKEKLVKSLVPFDLEKPDLLKRLFEEMYLGKDLFTKIYDVPSFFRFDSSLMDLEEFIPSKDTLEELRKMFGRFGIYSGRPEPQGMYVLEKYGYTGYFEELELVFLGNLLKSEEEMQRLGKPNPKLFVELIEKTVDKKAGIIYVGDGVADAVLVENAKAKGFGNLFFLGVVSSSEDSNKLFTEYSKHGADVVVSDVNDVPFLFKSLRGSV
jgi:phosphoglycolate phosphatase-like HAD superfamily hydrolase